MIAPIVFWIVVTIPQHLPVFQLFYGARDACKVADNRHDSAIYKAVWKPTEVCRKIKDEHGADTEWCAFMGYDFKEIEYTEVKCEVEISTSPIRIEGAK